LYFVHFVIGSGFRWAKLQGVVRLNGLTFIRKPHEQTVPIPTDLARGLSAATLGSPFSDGTT
jgi:hypothetical protein